MIGKIINISTWITVTQRSYKSPVNGTYFYVELLSVLFWSGYKNKFRYNFHNKEINILNARALCSTCLSIMPSNFLFFLKELNNYYLHVGYYEYQNIALH